MCKTGRGVNFSNNCTFNKYLELCILLRVLEQSSDIKRVILPKAHVAIKLIHLNYAVINDTVAIHSRSSRFFSSLSHSLFHVPLKIGLNVHAPFP